MVAVQIPFSGVYEGAYASNIAVPPAASASDQDQFAAIEGANYANRRLDIANHFTGTNPNVTSTTFEQAIFAMSGAQRIAMRTQRMFNPEEVVGWSGQTPTPNTPIHDTEINAIADALKALSGPVLFRLGWEFNITNYDHGGDKTNTRINAAGAAGSAPGGISWAAGDLTAGPQLYVAAFRRYRTLFNARGVTNVDFCWVSTRGKGISAAWNAWENYYPGNDVVDWVGCDGYNRNWWSSGWEEFQHLFDTSGVNGKSFYDLFAMGGTSNFMDPHTSTSVAKPYIVAEYSCGEATTNQASAGQSKSGWFDRISAYVQNKPGIKALVVFSNQCCTGPPDSPSAGCNGTEEDWTIDTTTASRDSFRALGQDSYYTPVFYVPPVGSVSPWAAKAGLRGKQRRRR